MQISISVNNDLLEKIDNHALKYGMSRSSFFTFAAVRQMQMDDMTEQMPVMTELAQKLKDVDFYKLIISDKKPQKNAKKKK